MRGDRSRARKILLVEDEALIALSTEQRLEARGYEVVVVHNGEDAVSTAVEDAEIDLVLMDIDLGAGIDGTEAAEQILRRRDLPVVFVSSHTEKELVDRVRRITRYGYVVKDSGDFVLNASIEMAFELFEANQREQEHAARYAAVIEAQPDLMFVMGLDGIVYEAYAPDNVSFAIPRSRIPGAHLRELFGEEEAQRHIAVYRRCAETGRVQTLDYQLQPDGYPRWFEARISRLDDETVLAIVREVTESRKMEAQLNRLAALQRVLVDIATSCINLPPTRIPEAVHSALASMARGIGADRAYVFDYDFDRELAVNSYEWCAPGIAPQIDQLQSLPLQEIDDAVKLHRQGLSHHVPDVQELPAGSLREVLEPQDISSLLTVPLVSAGACVGAVGFDWVREEHTVTPEEHGLLTVLAELLVNLREREEAQERLRVLFEGARDNILIHEVGPDGRPGNYIDVNPSTCETLGYSREELLAMSPLDTTAPEERGRVSATLATLKNDESVLVECTGKRKDGTLVPFELNLHRITVQGRDTVIAVSRDITERRKAEEMQRLISQMAPVAIYVYDLSQERLVFANAEYERQLGYAFEELHEKLHQDQDAGFFERDYRLERNDGGVTWSYIRENALTWKPDGAPETVIGIGIDVTERKEAEATIAALVEERGLLLTEVHHRIKNNMISMSSLLSLQAATTTDAEAAAALTEADSRMQSMAVLYDRLYRAENLREMPVSEYLPALVQEIIAAHARTDSILLDVDVCDAVLPVSILASVGMIVNEVLSNAIKYAFPAGGGTITVRADRSAEGLRIVLADNGPGLPDNVDLGSSGGFGLQLIQSLAAQHDFRVRFERNGGTRFVLETGASVPGSGRDPGGRVS